jgi:hypothetical protein
MYSKGIDQNNKERYFIMGGQKGEDERYGNQKLMYEFIPDAPSGKQWIRRADLLIERGHANASTRPYGCGIIMIAGTTNQPTGKIGSIHYYDIPSDTWTEIDNLGSDSNTPVCDIYTDSGRQDWVWCTSPRGLYRKKRLGF